MRKEFIVAMCCLTVGACIVFSIGVWGALRKSEVEKSVSVEDTEIGIQDELSDDEFHGDLSDTQMPDTEVVEEVTEDPRMYSIYHESDSAPYIGTYPSNVPIDNDILYTTDLYPDWYTMDDVDEAFNVHQLIIYGINYFYGGSIPCHFHSNIDTDVHDQKSNMIFEITVHGDDRDLNLKLDCITPTIYIEEFMH